jgi:hypothetical protein
VAWLVTAGSAVVPAWVDVEPEAFEDVEALLAGLPGRGDAMAEEASPAVRDWLEAAKRGVFGYDWNLYDGPYRLVARPTNPVAVADLPTALAALARRNRFAHLCFGDAPWLGVGDVEACTTS